MHNKLIEKVLKLHEVKPNDYVSQQQSQKQKRQVKKKKITLKFQLFTDRFLISFHKIYVKVSCDMHVDIHTYV